MKTCNRCNTEKTLDGFSPDPRMKDGYLNVCRVCRTKEIQDRKSRLAAGVGNKTVSEKRCSKCKQVKPSDSFNKSSTAVCGLASMCIDCNAKKQAAYRKEHRSDYNAYMRGYNATKSPYERYLIEILRRYGCTQEKYEQMLKDQDYKCALCSTKHNDKRRKGRLYVDHCHATGIIRGLLCHGCNVGLGLFKDDTRVMLEAVAYIIKHKKN